MYHRPVKISIGIDREINPKRALSLYRENLILEEAIGTGIKAIYRGIAGKLNPDASEIVVITAEE